MRIMPLRRLPFLLFMALLLLPLFAQFTGFPRIAPLQEYRKLAELPEAKTYFAGDKADFLGYTAKLNLWHLDNFATRAFWVRLRTQALFTLFRESDQLHIGPDNWLFYRSVIDKESPQVESLSTENRQKLVAKIAHLSELLDQRGIKLYVMPLALKSRYYPEFLPASASHAKRFRFYDDFMDRLVADRRLRVVDVRRPLEQAKREGLKLFHQTDFHWTDPAGAVAIRGLLREVAADEGLGARVEGWRYDIADEQFFGGQGRALPLLRTPREQTVVLKLQAPLTRFEYKTNQGAIEWSGVALPGQEPLLKPILAHGDSFLDAGSRAGFFNFFESFARARLGQAGLVQAYQQRQPGTRYLLLEWITSGTFMIDNDVTALVAALENEPREPLPQ